MIFFGAEEGRVCICFTRLVKLLRVVAFLVDFGLPFLEDGENVYTWGQSVIVPSYSHSLILSYSIIQGEFRGNMLMGMLFPRYHPPV